MPIKLPKKWIEVPFEDLCLSIETGRRPQGGARDYTDGTPSISGEHIDKVGRFKFANIRYIPNDFADQLVQGRIEEKDILIVKDGATTGKIAFVNDEFPYKKAFVNEHVFLCKLSRNVTPEYVYWFLWGKEGQERILKNFKGTAQGGINRLFGPNTLIPLAPSKEQKQIAESVNHTLTKILAIQSWLDKLPNLIADLRQLILHRAVTGKLTKDWRKKNKRVESASILLSRIINQRKRKYNRLLKMYEMKKGKKPTKNYLIEYGQHKTIKTWSNAKLDNLIYIAGRIGWRGLKADEYKKKGALFLSVYNLNRGKGFEIDLKHSYFISLERYNESPEIQLKNNDILLVKDGAGIGKIGIVSKLNQKGTINSSLLLIRAKEAFLADYLLYFLAGPGLQDLAKSRISGTAIPHLFQRDIKEFILPVPPKIEQKEIVKRVQTLYRRIDKVEDHYLRLKKSCIEIPQEILSKAYSGKLLPQNPKDEPVEKLLERIREEKERMLEERKELRTTRAEKKVGRRIMGKQKRKDLLEVIQSYPNGISPENLLYAAQYELKEIALFYKHLKRIREKIIEIKPSDSKQTWPKQSSVLLKARGE